MWYKFSQFSCGLLQKLDGHRLTIMESGENRFPNKYFIIVTQIKIQIISPRPLHVRRDLHMPLALHLYNRVCVREIWDFGESFKFNPVIFDNSNIF